MKGIITKENCICLISNHWIDKNNFEVRNHQNKWVAFPELKIIEDPTKFRADTLFYEIYTWYHNNINHNNYYYNYYYIFNNIDIDIHYHIV